MRTVVTILLFSALIYSALWTWQAYSTGTYHAPGTQGTSLGGITAGFGQALCGSWGC